MRVDRTAHSAALLVSLLGLGACATVGGTSDDPDSEASVPAPGSSPGSSYSYDGGGRSDAGGYAGSSGSSTGSRGANGVSFTVNDAAVDLGGLLSGAGSLFGASDGGTRSGGGSSSTRSADGGLAAQCLNAACVDVLDCYLLHADLGDCGFTACDGFVCK